MTASTPRGEVWHPLTPHGWHMEPLVLIEDTPGGPYLAALLPSVAARTVNDRDLDLPNVNALADRLIAQLTTPH